MPTVTLGNGRQFQAERGVSLLDAALAQGITLEHSCRTGRCGSCKARVLAGESSSLQAEPSLDVEALGEGWILTCAREAASDLTLDIEDLSALQGIVTKTLPCRIDRLELVAPDVLKIVLRLPPNSAFAFLPGQYVDITAPSGVRRSYSIASTASRPENLELHVKRYLEGAMSAYWFTQARVNDLLRFRGPLGTFFLRDMDGRELICLATGTGYAPIQSMLAQLSQLARLGEPQPFSARLYWGGRTLDDLYDDPTKRWGALEYTPVLSRADVTWSGARGHVQDVLLLTGVPLDNAVVYACGSDPMVRSARASLIAAGLPPQRFFADAFVESSAASRFVGST